jgi:hypothetical protein
MERPSIRGVTCPMGLRTHDRSVGAGRGAPSFLPSPESLPRRQGIWVSILSSGVRRRFPGRCGLLLIGDGSAAVWAEAVLRPKAFPTKGTLVRATVGTSPIQFHGTSIVQTMRAQQGASLPVDCHEAQRPLCCTDSLCVVGLYRTMPTGWAVRRLVSRGRAFVHPRLAQMRQEDLQRAYDWGTVGREYYRSGSCPDSVS